MDIIKEFIYKFRYMILIIFTLVIFLIGGTYAWVNIEIFGTKTHTISSGNLVITLDESTCSGINLVNNYPITDENGMAQVACTFTIKNSGSLDSEYNIFLDDLDLSSGERINDSNVKYSLKKNNTNSIGLVSSLGTNPERILENGIIKSSQTNTYELRFWIDINSSNDVAGKIFSTKLRIETINYQESGCTDLPTYGGIPNSPELVGDMIPVIYDGTNWVKADINNQTNSWYDYDNQMWANAVTVTSTNRATLVNSPVGTTIPMEDINTMMVWIPRYSYTIKDTYGIQGCGGDTPSQNTPGAFDIKFISENTTELGTATYTGNTAQNWFTNSAFCWGNSCDNEATRSNSENRELPGIWVAKFETSNSGSNTPEVLPNVTSWRNINVSTMFYSVLNNMNGATGTNIYGLSNSTYDAHMMKNTEWGAVAYLTQSRYGKYGNEDYTGVNKEVYQNKSSSYITGNSNGTPPQSTALTQCLYNELINRGNGTGGCGGGSSTTGNITGVYDMSGGTYEYVSANMLTTKGEFNFTYSGFTTVPESKYFNSYSKGSSVSDFTRYIKGDATKEVAGYYSNYSDFVANEYPWFVRGGRYTDGGSGGVFSFYDHNGYITTFDTFRITLVP